MAHYPIFLELTGRRCLVVGAGAVGFRKARALAAAGAEVHVVAPRLDRRFGRLDRQAGIRCSRRRFRRSDLRGKELVIAATGDRNLNARIASDSKAGGIWVNAVDQPEDCSFILPAVVRRGPLVLAVSTGGASPALAKRIRRDLERRYGREYELLLRAAAAERPGIKRKMRDPARRKRLFERALNAYFDTLQGNR